MKCITIDPLVDARWKGLIQHKQSSIFHSTEWMQVLKATYNFDVKANVLVDSHKQPSEPQSVALGTADSQQSVNGDSVAIAGLPYCHIADIRGERISSLPFCDFADPLVETLDEWQQLVDPLIDLDLPLKVRPLFAEAPILDSRFKENNRARWHGLELNASVDELWRQIKGSARTAIRKAQKQGVVINSDTSEADLRAFYELHVAVRKNKYRMVAQPYSFFQNIWSSLISKGLGRLLTASYNGEIIAATLFLQWGNTFYYKFNASNQDFLWLSPNEMMLWEGIKCAKERGCTLFDFGLSDWDQQGLIFYKEKFSSQEKTIHFLQYTPQVHKECDCVLKSSNADVGALLPRLTDLFTDEAVPDQIAQRAGELLYQYFA